MFACLLWYSLRPSGAENTMTFDLRVMMATSVAVVFLGGGVAAHGQGQNAKKEAPPKNIAIRAGRLIDGKSDSPITMR